MTQVQYNLQEVDKLIADEKNRLRALEHVSFIVEAPAGSGKTELLTQRYLSLLQTVNATEEIIAITFTNKAAAEMRLRILDGLISAANQTPPDKAHKKITYELSQKALQHAVEKDWKLIENPSRLRIFTIDSLCAHLARQMPLMSRFGSQPKVAEDATILYAQAAEQTFALLEETEHCETVKTALRYVDNNANQLKNLLVLMLAKRDQWLHHAQYEVSVNQLQNTLCSLIEQELSSIAEVLNPRIQHQLMPLARFAASQLPSEEPIALLKDWSTPLALNMNALPMWQAVRELLLTVDGKIRARIDKNIGFLPEHKDQKAEFKALLDDLVSVVGFAETLAKTKKLPFVSTFISTQQENWCMISSLSQLLKLAVAQLWLVFQRAGEVDFVEIAQRATQALSDNGGEPTDLALKLDYQIQHLLVDEFQDTSPSQIELLKQLTLGWQASDGRTLFCVGDPMQSIYRFRKANVSLFIHAAENGIGDIQLEKLQLYRNNRSSPQIVDWINQTFSQVFPIEDNESQGAVSYRESIADAHKSTPSKNAAESGVEVHAIIKSADIKNESTSDAKQREAEAVISIIQREQTENPSKKIAILVRAKNHLAPLVTQLRRTHRDIAFQAVEIEALAGRQIVQDLLALTHALHHRADRVHWLSILRAPWCGLTLHDLHALAGSNHRSTIWSLMQNESVVAHLSADGQMRLNHVRSIFTEAFATQGRMPLGRWVRGVWLMLGGASCLWEQSDVVDVQAFFKCLDDLDKRNQFSLERIVAEIEKLFATPDNHGENLQMMTIHKSKGLEFDTVILLGLGAKTSSNNSDKPLVLWEEVLIDEQLELLGAPYTPKGARDKDNVSPYDYLESRENLRDANEDTRVLYVAATRAEHKLHLVGVANQNKEGDIKALANTPLALLWPNVQQFFEAAALVKTVPIEALPMEAAQSTEDDITQFVPQLVRLQRPAIPTVLQAVATVTTYQNAIHQNATQLKPTHTNTIEADMGILAHRYMELIAKQGIQNWPLSRIAPLAPAMQYWLQQQGHNSQIASTATSQIIHALQTTLTSSAGQWVLQAHQHAQSEYALTSNDGTQHVLDRTFTENSVRWIIDYKLGLEVTEANANTVALAHKPQLARYAGLFTDENLSIKQAVFFLSLGILWVF